MNWKGGEDGKLLASSAGGGTTSCKASPRQALAPLTARAGASLARPHPLDAQHSLHPQSIVPRPTPLPQIGELPLIADAPRTPSVGADAWERGEARRQVVLGALQRMLREWRYIDPRWAGAPRLMWPPGDRTHGYACPHLSPHPETHRVRVAGAAPMRPLRLRHAFYSEHALFHSPHDTANATTPQLLERAAKPTRQAIASIVGGALRERMTAAAGGPAAMAVAAGPVAEAPAVPSPLAVASLPLLLLLIMMLVGVMGRRRADDGIY